jgi:hypothetical protein
VNRKAGKRITSATELTAFYHPVGLMDDLLVFIAQAPDYLNLDADQLPDNGPVIQEGHNPVSVIRRILNPKFSSQVVVKTWM